MSISLYDLSVGTYLQTISGVKTVMQKGREFAEQNNMEVDDLVGRKLHDDMLPFMFQINCMEMHSVHCLNGLEKGAFRPYYTEQRNYAELEQLLDTLSDDLSSRSEDQINSYEGKTMIFQFGDNEIPFTAENFVMSFSIPNILFHAATAYDILRHEGVELAKPDFLGRLRIGV